MQPPTSAQCVGLWASEQHTLVGGLVLIVECWGYGCMPPCRPPRSTASLHTALPVGLLLPPDSSPTLPRCRHQLVHYPGAFNRASRARQLAVSDDSSTLFHPSGSVVQASGADAGLLSLHHGSPCLPPAQRAPTATRHSAPTLTNNRCLTS